MRRLRRLRRSLRVWWFTWRVRRGQHPPITDGLAATRDHVLLIADVLHDHDLHEYENDVLDLGRAWSEKAWQAVVARDSEQLSVVTVTMLDEAMAILERAGVAKYGPGAIG